MKYKSIKFLSLLLAATLIFSSCGEDIKLPDIKIQFESNVSGIAAADKSLVVKINLSRAASNDVTATVSVKSASLVYGSDFTTIPAAVANVITLTIPKGETSASITLTKVEGVGFSGDETIEFEVTSVEGSPVIGDNSKITVTFSEITVASATMEIQGGGPTYPNRVFIDLSANRQTAVKRDTWDLGFSSGTDFRVILNSATGMMAYALDKTDLNAVTKADTAVLRNRLSMAAVFAAISGPPPAPDWVSSAINWIDDPAGDRTKTAIASISATASENKVYIINRGSGPGSPETNLGWKKIRVIRNSNGYTLQHADISATTFSEVQITKSTEYDFQYISFANGAVSVEPMSTRWDIAWSGFSSSTPFSSGIVPYYYQDIILQNPDVQTVQVMTSTKTYDAFGASDVASLDFGAQSQIKIGNTWRSGGGPSGGPTLRTDRFYVLKDSEGNIYKLRFKDLFNNGERGRPKVEFALINAAS